MNKKLIIAAMVAALLGVSSCSSDGGSSSNQAPTTTSPIKGVEMFGPLTRNHVEGHIDYPQSPPVGGDHNPVWQTCGVYDMPIANENAVHSLEHGAVWLAYRPDLPEDQVRILRGIARGHSHVLVSPYPGLTDGIVATAWGLQLRLESVDDPRLVQFVALYEQGPQTPEFGVTCSGGVGNPIE